MIEYLIPVLVLLWLLYYLYYADGGNSKGEEQQQHQNFTDEPTTESTASTAIGKNLINEDDSKSAYAVDSPVCFIILNMLVFKICLTPIYKHL